MDFVIYSFFFFFLAVFGYVLCVKDCKLSMYIILIMTVMTVVKLFYMMYFSYYKNEYVPDW